MDGYRRGMDVLTGAWVLSLLVAMVSAPMAVVRTYAYVSGERDHTPTMRTAMLVAVGITAVALACLLVLSVVLVVRG